MSDWRTEARKDDSTMVSMNTPMYDEKGRRVAWAETWRIPRVPFAKPSCCGATRMIGWNVYRCNACATLLEPERLWHRLLFKRNPFGPTGARHLFRVVRVTSRPGRTGGSHE